MTNARQDPFSLEVLEFSGIVELLRHFLSGPIAEPRLAALKPRTQLEEIRLDLERAAEAREYLRASPRPGLRQLKDPRSILEKVRIEGVVLTAFEILRLLELARAAHDCRSLVAQTPFHRLARLLGDLADFGKLLGELAGKILPDGSVDSSASPALARIRKDIERLRHELQSTLEKLLLRLSRDQVLQDAVVTVRNERFVIPVRAEEKRRVHGVVHGASSSGATVYIEPLETLPLNNELVELQEKEFAEIQRVLADFSQKLRGRRPELQGATDILSELDLAFAKAEFARASDCCTPEFVSRSTLLLKGVRHPLLEQALRSQEHRPVPLTLELNEPRTMMVISGPNTGGKTVALKTLGIAVLMAQAGLPVAAEEARLPLYGRVLADIGDQQSMQANLSTFSAHISNIQSMLEVAVPGDLVLLDELGSSTEPNEGAALGVAILEHFRLLGAMTFVTTHHSRLKAYAAETPQAVNAAMEFDEATLAPTYKLTIGLPGKSSALDIARRLGLEPAVVDKARGLLHSADAEAATLIAKLHEQRDEMEHQAALLEVQRRELSARQASLEHEFQEERRVKLKELDARLEETLRRLESRLESVIGDFESRQLAEAQKKLGRKLALIKNQAREDWNAQVLETHGARAAPGVSPVETVPAVGDRVRLIGVSTPGTVTARADDQLEVEVGRLRMRVRQEDVQVVAPAKPIASKPAASVGPVEDVPEELNVIGSTAEEARQRVDKFLDQAYLAGRFRLRIVHGHGKGILKKALREMLATHPHVAKFDSAPLQEGGGGATIVELKM